MNQARKTQQQHLERVNEALHYIHANLGEELDIPILAERSFYSLHHFQRIFKEITQETVHEYIKRTRLEWAGNLLMFNRDSSVAEVAQDCGFHSLSSFTHAFKNMFDVTPGQWRRNRYQATDDKELSATPRNGLIDSIEVKKCGVKRVAYVRHIGYDKSISKAWTRLLDWNTAKGLSKSGFEMIGLHHSNPAQVPREQCRYVACVTVPKKQFRSGGISIMDIPGGVHLCCRAKGQYGEVLVVWNYLYNHWLPGSQYEAMPIPGHVIYYQNHLLEGASDEFDIELRIPVRSQFF